MNTISIPKVSLPSVSLPSVMLQGQSKEEDNGIYNYCYGIEWDTTNPGKPKRIGSTKLHKSLPIQSNIRRCLLKDDGTVNYYLHPDDSNKRIDGTDADLTGADGQYMVELPEVYVRFETDGTICRCLLSTKPLKGFHFWRKDYVSAVEATVHRPTNTLCSVVNNTADYRGGNNQAAWDELSKTMLGKPATSINLTQFRKYARQRGSTEWNCYLYQTYKKLWWLYAVEYCNFNSQDAFNVELTTDGFHQGGLGVGVTILDFQKWTKFNEGYPMIPCGITNSLGDQTGIVEYIIPDDYYPDIVVKVDVPSYRGIENPFGHIWGLMDGCLCSIKLNADKIESQLFVCNEPVQFANIINTGYEYRGNFSNSIGYVKSLILGEYGEILPLAIGATNSTYFYDYFYTNTAINKESLRTVTLGGNAHSKNQAGFIFSATDNAITTNSPNLGTRLCFYPEQEQIDNIDIPHDQLKYLPLTHKRALLILNGLAEVTTPETITFKDVTYDTLTEEDIAIATNKGWTVARYPAILSENSITDNVMFSSSELHDTYGVGDTSVQGGGGEYNKTTIGKAIINALAEVSETKTCVIQDYVYDELSDEDKEAATNKGWEIDRYPLLNGSAIGFKIYPWLKWEGDMD